MPKDPCSELSKTVADIAMNIGSDPNVHTIDDVVKVMQKDFPEFTRGEVVNAIVEATTGHSKVMDDVQKNLAGLRREARADVQLRAKINQLQSHLGAGTLPAGSARPTANPSEVIADLRAIQKDLGKQVRGSDPAVRKRLQQQIDALTERLEGVAELPAAKPDPVRSKEAERLAYQRDRLRQQIRQRVADLKPRTTFQKIWDATGVMRMLQTTGEFSFVLRQGGVRALSHPIRQSADTVRAFRALASGQYAHRVEQEIMNRPNAPLYARTKLAIIPESGGFSAAEELRVSSWVDKIPGIPQFSRAGRVFLNKIRADSFDAMAESLARNGEPTLQEAQAIATFVNESTGRGSLGKSERAAAFLNETFFSARYLASRFQMLAGHSMWGGTGRSRRLIAAEYARTFTGLATVYALAHMAGAEIEKDPRSSDFGKLRFGNTRIDPLMGLSQLIVFGSRLATGERKTSAGQIVPIRGEIPYGQPDAFRVSADFLRTKLAPMPGMVFDLLTQKNVVGEPVDATYPVEKVAPMTYGDVLKAMQEQGVPRGSAMSILAFFGYGLQTYDKNKKAKQSQEGRSR